MKVFKKISLAVIIFIFGVFFIPQETFAASNRVDVKDPTITIVAPNKIIYTANISIMKVGGKGTVQSGVVSDNVLKNISINLIGTDYFNETISSGTLSGLKYEYGKPQKITQSFINHSFNTNNEPFNVKVESADSNLVYIDGDTTTKEYTWNSFNKTSVTLDPLVITKVSADSANVKIGILYSNALKNGTPVPPNQRSVTLVVRPYDRFNANTKPVYNETLGVNLVYGKKYQADILVSGFDFQTKYYATLTESVLSKDKTATSAPFTLRDLTISNNGTGSGPGGNTIVPKNPTNTGTGSGTGAGTGTGTIAGTSDTPSDGSGGTPETPEQPKKDPVLLKNPLRAGLDTIPAIAGAIVENIVIPIALPFLAMSIIWTGFLFVKARGKPDEITKAREALKWTIIGGLLILGSFLIATALQGTIKDIMGR